jgi:outer membrane receptor protein involved in Fe transport
VTGGRFDRLDARAFISLPLSNTLKSSLTFSSKDREGYQKRIPFPGGPIVTDPPEAFIDPTQTFPAGLDSSDAEGGIDEFTVRAKLLWEPSDRLSATISADRTRIDQPAMPNSILATTENVPGPLLGLAENNIPGSGLDVVTGTSGFASFAGLYNFCIGATPADIAARNAQGICGPRGTIIKPENIIQGLGGLNTDGDPNNDRLPYDSRYITDDIDETYATGQSLTDMDIEGYSLTVDFDINDELALKSITAYRELDWATGLDLDGSPIDILGTSPTFGMFQDQFSQEVQLIGTALGGNLSYVVGAMYFEEDGGLQDTVNFSSGLLQILGPNDLSTENWGIFAQIDWRLSELIGVTIGGRYTEEDKTFLGGQTDNNGFSYKLFNVPATIDPAILTAAAPLVGFPEPDQPLRYFIDEEQKQKFDNFDPRIAVQFYPADDLMFYGSYATGLKTGGWSTRLSNPLDFAPSFSEETVETWEVGMKAQFLGNRLQVNAAAFTSDFEDIQLNFQLGVSPTIQNAGDAEIEGVELEIVAVPTPALMINMSLGWIDAEFTDVLEPAQVAPNAFQAGVFPGAELPKTPEWQFNISPSYDIPLNDGASVRILVDYTYQSELWNDTERTFLLEREATDMLNANVTYTSADGAWDVVLGGTNLLDERYLTTGQAQIGGGQIYGTFSRPEEWYFTVRYRH